MWEELARTYPCFIRSMADCFCRVYEINDRLWRWEVLRREAEAAGRYALERAGTQPSLDRAIDAAEIYVRDAPPAPPG
jgi:hypothetical protein